MIYRMELRKKQCRVKEACVLYGVPITKPRQAASLAKRLLEGEMQEVVIAIYLNVKNEILGFSEVARGGFDLCQVDPRVVFAPALLSGATSLILAHNHPSSGDSRPSEDDILLTERAMEGAKLLGMVVLDHLFFARRPLPLGRGGMALRCSLLDLLTTATL